jgi:hypothetical protein
MEKEIIKLECLIHVMKNYNKYKRYNSKLY